MVKVIKSGAKKGFSLVEISVVMAIIGLLLGGVLAGQALLNGQRKNALISKAKELRFAIQQFKLKYGYYAGDFPTATQVWGRADGGSPITANCANPDSDNVNPNGTCNGNGNGNLRFDWTEPARSWQQLRLAGMLNGLYNGVYASPPVPNVTAPAIEGKLNSTVTILSDTYDSSAYEFYEGDYSGAIMYGVDNNDSSFGGGAVFSGEEAYTIDRKVDDGLPATGIVRALREDSYYRPGCPTADAYPVNVKDDVCALVFMGEKS